MSTADRLSAVVLAGTHHWSGSSFERLAPRPLVPVALAPLVSYPLGWLARAGVRRATLCANGATHALQATLGDGAALQMELGYYQDGTPRGAAGCVHDAGLRLGSKTLVVADGAAIPTVDLTELLASHYASGAALTAVVHREGAGSGSATPSGVYVFERRVLEHVAASGFQDIKENLIPKLRRAGERVVAFETAGFCPHVFNAQTYLAVNQWMLQRLARQEPGAGGLLVHPSACVEPGARLVGPVQLGPGVRVQAGATVVGPTTIGAESIVGRNALVARSVVWSRCALGDGSVVHGSVVGNDVVLLPSARLFNVVRPHTPVPAVPAGRSWRAPSRPPASSTAAPDPAPMGLVPASHPPSCVLG
jgi:NDP-sugar pyrophosphorylase family protein